MPGENNGGAGDGGAQNNGGAGGGGAQNNGGAGGGGAQNNGGAGGGGGKSVTEQITDATGAAVTQVLDALGIDTGGGNDDGKGGDAVNGGNGNGGGGGRGSARDTEASFGAAVRAEMERVRADEKRDGAIAELQTKVEAIPEQAPRKLSRFTRMIWGGDE